MQRRTTMKQLTKIITAGALLILSMWGHAAGLLTAKNSHLGELDLAEHHVDVIIEDAYVTTTVTQIFHNPHSYDLTAIYSFPVPNKGAVGEFSLWIDGKKVTGEVVKKAKAQKIFQQEKEAGRQVGLTEQNSYKTFEVQVHPVRAGAETKIQLRYFQPAKVDLGVGRYVYQLEEGGVDEEVMAFWNTNSKVSKAFSFDLTLRSSYPVDALRLPNHAQAMVTQKNPNEWTVSLRKKGNITVKPQVNNDEVVKELHSSYALAHPLEVEQEQQQSAASSNTSSNAFQLDRDLVVYWRLQPDLPGSIDLITYRPDANKKGTFMMVFTPGDELTPIQAGADWNFVLDSSGSMTGKIASLTEGVSRAIEKMRPQDRFRIIMFDSSARELTPGYTNATPENVKHYINELAQVKPANSTNLYAGLKAALTSLDADRSSAIILVTDGVANIGQTKKSAFFNLLEKKDVRLFSFIMGNSANEPLLEPLARHSGGFALSISNSDDIIGRVLQAKDKLSHTAFHDVEVSIDGVKVSDVTPDKIGSLYRGQQLVMMGHYRQSGLATVEFKTKLSGQKRVFKTQVNFASQSDLNPELERLWAFAKIDELNQRMQDFAEEDHQTAVTDIALEYGLVTEQTSMIVMQEEQYQHYQIKRNNKKRTETEEQARQKRAQQPVRPTRADSQQPAFNKNRPSSGGGSGSFGLWFMLFVLLLIFTRKRH